MIKCTRLDGTHIYLNENNIQWIESLPDTTITFLSGARLIVREKIENVLKIIEDTLQREKEYQNSPQENSSSERASL